jgi:hypothetical protein
MRDNPAKITFHKRATVALDALSAEEKSIILKAINYLSVFGIETLSGDKVKKFKLDEPLYLLRANPNLRVIFRVISQDEMEILDIVMKERLEFFAANKS